MEIEDNELEKERSGSRALHVQNLLMDLYAVNCQLKELKRDGATSFIGQMR